MRKRFLPLILIGAMMCCSLTALADYDIYQRLPSYKGDVEEEPCLKCTSSNKFMVKITSISNGFNSVNVWTEKPAGGNLSSPYYAVNAGTTNNIQYTEVPALNTNVVLNLDNPEYSAVQPLVIGEWNPN